MAEQPAGEDQQRLQTKSASRAWWALGGGLVLLLLAIVFVAQNGNDVAVHFLFLKGHITLGLALLLSAVLGGLIVLLLGAGAVLRVRRQAKRARRAAAAD
jgi:uncharacterized integral membrane protein